MAKDKVYLTPEQVAARKAPTDFKQMEKDPSKNGGQAYVIFEALKYEGRNNKPYHEEQIVNLAFAGGDVNYLRKLTSKGWKIKEVGNLELVKRTGIFPEAVETHQDIYQYASGQIKAYEAEKKAEKIIASAEESSVKSTPKSTDKQDPK